LSQHCKTVKIAITLRGLDMTIRYYKSPFHAIHPKWKAELILLWIRIKALIGSGSGG